MGDDRPDDVMEPGRAKRPPPTIDLSATEVPRDETIDDESVVNPDPPINEPPPKSRGGGIGMAALSGALAGGVVASLAWFANSTWPTSASDPQPVAPQVQVSTVNDLTARLARLEARPMPAPQVAGSPPPDLSSITARLDALDTSVASLRDETTALRAQQAQALATASDAQKDTQSQPTPVAPDLSGITSRLAAIETRLQDQDAKMAAQASKPVDEAATRRLAAAALLDAQVRAGEPFAATLAVAKTLAPDAAKLAPLDAFATAGVPSADALARALLDLPQLAPPPPPPSTGTAGGLIDRLTSGATKLVKIERTDAPNADNAIFTRAADAARRDDLATAARELGTLPPAERTSVQPWLDRVAARDAARAASRQFANDALAAMSKP